MNTPRNEPRKPMGYGLRFLFINALLVISFVQIERGGAVTGKVIAVYVGMAAVANGLMYFGAQARTRSMERQRQE